VGCRAEGAAQGYTVLGGIVLLVFAINMLRQGLDELSGSVFEGALTIVLGIALIIVVALSFDASGYTHFKIGRSGALLALLGFIAIVLIARGLTFDILGWLTNIGMLAGFMILLAGLLLIFKK